MLSMKIADSGTSEAVKDKQAGTKSI